MLRLFPAVALTIVMFWSVPVSAQKKGPKKKDTGVAASEPEYAKLVQDREATGKVVSRDPEIQGLTIRVEFQQWEANPNFKPNKPGLGGGNPLQAQMLKIQQQMQKLQFEQQKLIYIKDPRQYQQKMQKIAFDTKRLQYEMYQLQVKIQQQQGANPKGANPKDPNGPFKMVTTAKDFDLTLKEGLEVRRLELPIVYDDRGFIKEFTPEEKQKLRGKDSNKPGYQAKIDDLEAGQKLKVYLSPSGNTPKKKLEGENAEILIPRPLVTMVIILEESPGSPVAPAKKAPKKK